MDFSDIVGSEAFLTVEPIYKGWSSDKKYYLKTTDQRQLLLRISDIKEYEAKKREYTLTKQVAALGVPMSQPLEFGVCAEGKGVYSLWSWCAGDDAEKVLPSLPEEEQYQLGLKAGEILRKMHSIAAPTEQEDWALRFGRKTDTKLRTYKECGLRFSGDEHVIEYLEANKNLLNNRPQSYQHGDYHVGNMIIDASENLFIIDFNRHDFGDPWEEFNRIVFSAAASPPFATGQINGYFGGRPPALFFRLLADRKSVV